MMTFRTVCRKLERSQVTACGMLDGVVSLSLRRLAAGEYAHLLFTLGKEDRRIVALALELLAMERFSAILYNRSPTFCGPEFDTPKSSLVRWRVDRRNTIVWRAAAVPILVSLYVWLVRFADRSRERRMVLLSLRYVRHPRRNPCRRASVERRASGCSVMVSHECDDEHDSEASDRDEEAADGPRPPAGYAAVSLVHLARLTAHSRRQFLSKLGDPLCRPLTWMIHVDRTGCRIRRVTEGLLSVGADESSGIPPTSTV